MSFYELGLDTPLVAVEVHDSRTCTKECCHQMRTHTVVTPAGTRLHAQRGSPFAEVATHALLGAVEELGLPDSPESLTLPQPPEPPEPPKPPNLDAAAATEAFETVRVDPYDSSATDDLCETNGNVDTEALFSEAALADAAQVSACALRTREEATRLCVLAINATGSTPQDCVLQCVLKCYTETGEGVMGYDRLWTIPEETKISIKAFKAHKVHYRDLRFAGMDPRQELATVMAVLQRLHARNVRILVHNAKPTLRLLEQTAMQNGATNWTFPFPYTNLAIKAKRILNMPAKANPRLQAMPSERDVYAYLYKKQYDDEDDDVTSVSELASTCKITVRNFLAGLGRGWWD